MSTGVPRTLMDFACAVGMAADLLQDDAFAFGEAASIACACTSLMGITSQLSQ